MSEMGNKIESVEKDIRYFGEMIDGADRLIEKAVKPWKVIALTLAIAVVLCNAIWAGVHGYAIYKAYQEPSTYEQNQDQDFTGEKQNQSNKGSVN